MMIYGASDFSKVRYDIGTLLLKRARAYTIIRGIGIWC